MRSVSDKEKGVALLMAIIATVIIIALVMLVFYISTSDLRSSAQTVGEKKALSAAEAGIHFLIQNFDPGSPETVAVQRRPVDSNTDPGSVFTVTTPGTPSSGPMFLPLAGFSIGGGQSWGQRRYVSNVTGENTRYKTKVDISVGIGYGPIEITTMSR